MGFRRLMTLVITIGLFLFFLHLQNPLNERFRPLLFDTSSKEIPNIVHYVWTLPDPSADFHFEFKHFLSIYAAKLRWYPKTIHIHTNALD